MPLVASLALVVIALALVVLAGVAVLVAPHVVKIAKLRKPLAGWLDYKIKSDKLGDDFLQSLEQASGLQGRDAQQHQFASAPKMGATYSNGAGDGAS